MGAVETAQTSRRTVLVVEDEKNIRDLVCLHLGLEGYTCVPATSGTEALELASRETFDLLGVKFEGHGDLRRILLPSDFDGHALRKDYPLRGYEPYSMN